MTKQSIRLVALTLLSSVVVLTGCKSNPKHASVVVVPDFAEPSLRYMAQDTDPNDISAEQWVTIAQAAFAEKQYARALRAANEALRTQGDIKEARKIAMLSTIKITQDYSKDYHDAAVMSVEGSDDFKEDLTRVTTLINKVK